MLDLADEVFPVLMGTCRSCADPGEDLVRGLAFTCYIPRSVVDVLESDVYEVSEGSEFVGVDGSDGGGKFVLLRYA